MSEQTQQVIEIAKKIGGRGLLKWLILPIALTLLLPFCCCCLPVLLTANSTTQKHEFAWPWGVTPVAGGAVGYALPQGEGDEGYRDYRSVGILITSPYGWRTYMDENMLPVPGEYEFHSGIDLAGAGMGYHDPMYPLLDGQPYYIGFYGDPPYYGGAGMVVMIWNVHSLEEAPVKVLYGHLAAYEIDVETYCPDNDRYEPNIPITVACIREVVPEKGQEGDKTGADGKAHFYNGTPGKCTARVRWPEDYEARSAVAIEFNQRIDEERGIAHDALVRFHGCPRRPSPTATSTPTPTPEGQTEADYTAEKQDAKVAWGIGGPEVQRADATQTRQPSPTPRETATPAPSPTSTSPPTVGGPTSLPTPTQTPIPSVEPTIAPPPGTVGPTPTPTRISSPTPTFTPSPTFTPAPTHTPAPPTVANPTCTPPATPRPTWPSEPTSTPFPWPTWPTATAGPTRPIEPTAPPATPPMTPAPRPTTAPHECPLEETLCYFPGFGPPITMRSELQQGRTILGYIGSSGRTTGPHLHLSVFIWGLEQIDVLAYQRPEENGVPVPEDKLHYYNRYPEWIDPLQFLPQANNEMGSAFMDQPLQLPGPDPFIPEAGAGTWHSPADVYSEGGGGRWMGWDFSRLICGWFHWLCR